MTSSTRLYCPHCQARMKSNLPVPAGKRVKCLRCGEPFQVNEDPAASPMPGAAPSEDGGRDEVSPNATMRTGMKLFLLLTEVGLLLLGGGLTAVCSFLLDDAGPSRSSLTPPAGNMKVAGNGKTEHLTLKTDFPNPSVTATIEVEPPPPPSNDPPAVGIGPGISQQKIDAAIAKGVTFLQNAAQPNGQWPAFPGHPLGSTSLPGLTLLECGVPTHAPVVQKAADFVRETVRAALPANNKTYDLALAVLFLERVGDPKDRPLIQNVALRLVASQDKNGGWGYDCPQFAKPEAEQQLLAFLMTRPEGDKQKPLPDSYRLTPALGGGDNSNTQFAILALWAARRQGVPSDDALLLAKERFLKSQHSDGGWSYIPIGGGSKNTMNCAGLLGLAAGYGIELPIQRIHPESTITPASTSPAIQRGLEALEKHIGVPGSVNAQPKVPDLYFLWSVERVCMMFDLRTIGSKDWYTWGAESILQHQKANGSWFNQYTAPVDTSFALLFLKRSNLVSDLKETLRLHMAIPKVN